MSKTFQHITFPNGFQLIYEKSFVDLPITCMHVGCDIGSAYENDNNRGVSHFIEHMCFKRTKYKSTEQISLEIERHGAEVSALTNKRTTQLTVTCDNKSIDDFIQLLSDITLNTIFTKKDFDCEYDVVIQEALKNKDDLEINNYIVANSLLYKGSSYEYDTDLLSYHKNRNRLSLYQLVEMYKKMYVPSRMALSIVTPLSFERIQKFVQKSWFVKTTRTNSGYSIPRIKYSLEQQTNIRYKLTSKKGVESNVIDMSFRICGFSSHDKYCLNLLENILGDTYSSRVYTIMREKNGLIYHPSVSITHYEYYGDFNLSLMTKPEFVIRVLKLLAGILHDLVIRGVSEDELEVAKGRKHGRIELEKIDIERQVENHLDEWLLNNGVVCPTSKDEYAEFYKPIQKRQMDEVIRKYIFRENICLSIMGDTLPALKTVQSIFG
jgi:predicted Zn-dependent peptidase